MSLPEGFAFREDVPPPGHGLAPPTSLTAIAAFTLGVLSLVLGPLTAIPAIFLGFLARERIRHGRGEIGGKEFAAWGLWLGMFGFLWGFFLLGLGQYLMAQAELRSSMASQNNLRTLMLALHSHHDTMASLPAGGSVEATHPRGSLEQRRQFSWRARITPFLDQESLYDRIAWDEPWDGPTNTKLHREMSPTYRSPARWAADFKTHYLGVGNKKSLEPESTLFGAGDQDVRLQQITDGTSCTIAIVEADDATEWMRPRDLDFDPQRPKAGLGQLRGHGFLAVMADGSVRVIGNDVDDETFRRLMLRNDGRPVEYNPE